MKIYLDTSQFDNCLETPHCYSGNIEEKQKDIQSYWKLQLSLDSFIEECFLPTNADIIFLHLLEYPLDIKQQPTYVWFYYEPLKTEIQEITTHKWILGWNVVSSLDSPPKISWETLVSKNHQKPQTVFLPLVKPILEQSGEDISTVFYAPNNVDEIMKKEIKLDINSCHIGFHDPTCGLLIEKQKVSTHIFETLTRNRLSKNQLPQKINFEWKEFLGSGFSLQENISLQTKLKTTLQTGNNHQKKLVQGIPPFHSWNYNPEQAMYLEIPNNSNAAEFAWVTTVLSRKHWECVSKTLSKLYLSKQRPCYIFYFKNVFDIKDKNIHQTSLDFIFYQELSHLLKSDTPETLVTLTAIYHTHAQNVFYFDPLFTPFNKLDYHTLPENSIFFHRTQFYEKSYLNQEWISHYLTYSQQEKLDDIDQHLFFFSREKNWYSLQVAIWFYQHITQHEENTASQLLVLGMESISQNYQLSKKTDMRVLISQDLGLGFACHHILSTTWCNYHTITYTKHIKDIFQRHVPFQWKSDLGCLVTLSSQAEDIVVEKNVPQM